MHLVTLKNCRYSLDGRNLIDDVSLTVEAHRVNLLMGENGIGKSLLLDIIAGVIKPSSGCVIQSIRDEQIGYISQQLDLPYLLTLKEAIRYFSILMDSKIKTCDFNKIFESFHPKVKAIISKCNDQRSSKCSLGEKKLVLINLMMICGQYQLVIFDEPTSGLSPENRKLFQLLCRQALDRGITILFSTHLVQDRMPSDKVIDLNPLAAV